MTQLEALKKHLKRRRTITQLEAFTELGICRLSERVRELESSGYKFLRNRIEAKSRYGSASVVRYQLVAAGE